MSSHHIVRDDQEPALIIANGEVCSSELLGQLLEWSPIVIVLDSAIERILELIFDLDCLDKPLKSRQISNLQRKFENVESEPLSYNQIGLINTEHKNAFSINHNLSLLIETKNKKSLSDDRSHRRGELRISAEIRFLLN